MPTCTLRTSQHATHAILVLLVTVLCLPAMAAEPLRVAVAASFAAPFKILLAERSGGPPVQLAVAASGVLASQIRAGAPFDLFLSADHARPAALVADKAATPASLRTYARGQLALWVHPASIPAAGGCAAHLHQGKGRLALAEPRLAPYGQAAVATLAALGLTATWQDRQVRGLNVSQAWLMARSGAASAALVAASQAQQAGDGCTWLVPGNLHPPILQTAVVPAGSRAPAAANALLDWLLSPAVQTRLATLGFQPADPLHAG